MLRNLSITNYALIQQLDIDFNNGLSTMTGETGAGKSIILGALSLLSGNRADSGILNNPDKKCIIEATFQLKKDPVLEQKFENNDIDFETTCIIRRQIAPNGKSRAFINDTPVVLGLLKEIGSQLIDIHSQHQTLDLNKNTFQLNILDTFAGINGELTEYQNSFTNWQKLNRQLTEMQAKANKVKNEYDFIAFQYKELNDAALKPGEAEELEMEQEKLSHAEEIKSSFSNTALLFNDEERGILTGLKDGLQLLNKIQDFDPKYKELATRIDSSYLELKDIAEETENISERIDLNQEKLEEVNQRLSLIYNLQQKHQAENLEELIAIREKLNEQVSQAETYDFDLEQLQKQTDTAFNSAIKAGKLISKIRSKAIPNIGSYINDLLMQMGMPNANFLIEQNQQNQLTEYGIDSINFLFSANKQVAPQDISKVASGGELSRLMLSLKSLLAGTGNFPTIIFDEIDTGVSGDIADKMGKLIKSMSENIQIINITHLPQIASKGDYHYKVYKTDNEHSTYTNIKLLNKQERVEEIAKMLSGETITNEAISNAKSLLSS